MHALRRFRALPVWAALLAVPLAAQTGADPLAHLRPGHPRLLLTDDGLAAALAAAKTDPLREALHRRIVMTAEAILSAPPIGHNDGKAVQEQERYAVYDILTSAMAYRLTGDDRFSARVRKDLLTAVALPDWDPRHDLSVGEMSFAVALGYDWLFPQLSGAARSAVRSALRERALRFADASYRARAGWTVNRSNHNQVCTSGLACAALALADDEPDLARAVLRQIHLSMQYALAPYAPDGAYPEGPGYWTYGTTYSTIMFAALESALGTDLGLSRAPGFARTIEFYEAVEGPFGSVFNYADSTDDLQNSPARAWLAQRYRVPAATRHTRALLADTLARGDVILFDRTVQRLVTNRFFALHAVWFPQPEDAAAIEGSASLPLDFHFSGPADVATFRSGWGDRAALFIGLKAGEAGISHSHLDLGSFVLDADGQRWAMDLGSGAVNGSYDLPGYFDVRGRRWTYFRVNNHSHNTVTPGDALQARHVVAPIVAFGSTPQRAYAITDLAPVYPDVAATLLRGVALLDRARVLVEDEYVPAHAGAPLHWAMVTPAKIDVERSGHRAWLTLGGRSLRAEILEPAAARFEVRSTHPASLREPKNEGTAMLTIDLPPSPTAERTRLAVLLSPAGSKWPKLDPPPVHPLATWH